MSTTDRRDSAIADRMHALLQVSAVNCRDCQFWQRVNKSEMPVCCNQVSAWAGLKTLGGFTCFGGKK